MQVTTHQAGLGSSIARLALARRIALAALAIFLMLNAVTPFITPDPPWRANLPLASRRDYGVSAGVWLVAYSRGAGACCRSREF